MARRAGGARSNAEWERWGEVDPLYGVSSWSGKRAGEANAWTEEEFFELGEQDWADFHRRWERYGLTAGVCVEVGCGAGRMTRAMGGTFEHVHGLDVSAGMLERAAEAVVGLPVTLHQVDGHTIPLPDESADAAFSTHVFQHLDSLDDVEANFRELARVLRPGGTLLIHLPVHLWPGGLERLQVVYDARRRLGDVRARVKRRQMAKDPNVEPIMRGQCYRWETLEELLGGLGFIDQELTVFRVSSNGSPHSCALARRG
jgi:ubiquinone/menaquinone biosynthesis C-methylase UbiE